MKVMFGENIGTEDRQKVTKNLEEYCGLDTMGMVEILRVLNKTIGMSRGIS